MSEHSEGRRTVRTARAEIQGKFFFEYDVGGSHGDDYENYCLQGCCTVRSGTEVQTFRRTLLLLP